MVRPITRSRWIYKKFIISIYMQVHYSYLCWIKTGINNVGGEMFYGPESDITTYFVNFFDQVQLYILKWAICIKHVNVYNVSTIFFKPWNRWSYYINTFLTLRECKFLLVLHIRHELQQRQIKALKHNLYDSCYQNMFISQFCFPYNKAQWNGMKQRIEIKHSRL